MTTTDAPLLTLTAGDLMSYDVKSVPAEMPLREAARELARLGVHGAPVVDQSGRCVGVLSVSDLARWAARQAEVTPPPRACNYQEILRESGGRETILCLLQPGACTLQRFQERAGGRLTVVCADPHGLCTDWQVVEPETLPTEEVRQFMSTDPVTADVSMLITSLARLMLGRSVLRVIVIDSSGRPVGVVSATDILAALARSAVVEGVGR